MFVTFEKTPSLDKKELYECEVLWNKIVKEMKIFVLKIFDLIHVKFMVKEWCCMLIIHKQ